MSFRKIVASLLLIADRGLELFDSDALMEEILELVLGLPLGKWTLKLPNPQPA